MLLRRFGVFDGACSCGRYRNIHGKFSLRYYLNLVLVDEEDRRYFKQQEITLWRRDAQTKVLL